MSDLRTIIEGWNEGHREFAIAMGGVPEADLWTRPHPRLLSIGEIAGHIAYWQAVWILGGGNSKPELSTLPIQSPLIDEGFRYYTSTVGAPYRVALGLDELLAEVMRVHAFVEATLDGKQADDAYPGGWGTWGALIQYQSFHIAYHTGQLYSVRHLLGHETEDN